MAFPINTGIPAANNNPSVDQQPMQQNFFNINGFLAVDHVTPGSNNQAGQHDQVTLSIKQSAPGLPNSAVGAVYANSGTASTNSQLLFQNASTSFQISAIRAWGYSNTSGIISSQSFNVSSVVRETSFPTGVFKVTMTAGATSSSNFAVLALAVPGVGSNVPLVTFSNTGTTTFDLVFRIASSGVLVDPSAFAFAVLQI